MLFYLGIAASVLLAVMEAIYGVNIPCGKACQHFGRMQKHSLRRHARKLLLLKYLDRNRTRMLRLGIHPPETAVSRTPYYLQQRRNIHRIFRLMRQWVHSRLDPLS